MRDRLPTISPATYARVSLVALAALALIVLTGAAVRLTGSGRVFVCANLLSKRDQFRPSDCGVSGSVRIRVRG